MNFASGECTCEMLFVRQRTYFQMKSIEIHVRKFKVFYLRSSLRSRLVGKCRCFGCCCCENRKCAKDIRSESGGHIVNTSNLPKHRHSTSAFFYELTKGINLLYLGGKYNFKKCRFYMHHCLDWKVYENTILILKFSPNRRRHSN